MNLLSSLHGWIGKGGRCPRARQHRCRLYLEILEDRSVPSTTAAPLPVPLLPVDPPAAAGDRSYLGQNPSPELGHHMALAVADLSDKGLDDFVYADEWMNRIVVDVAAPHQEWVEDPAAGMLHPRAVQLADLNGDGLPDLVVANTGGDRVCVYLNEGGGRLGPRREFATGNSPAGLTIADVNGDGIPDLVVANQGSNDVSILFGRGSGADWALVPGPRLRVGAGPVATVVRDVTGDGRVDLFVVNSASNDVYQLNGLGGGTFDDAHPIIYPVGVDPQAVFLGNFDGQPGPDLVAVNFGSDDLTFFADPTFTGPPAPGRSIHCGHAPVAGLEGDFQHRGIDELVVADNGDGSVTFLAGTKDGPVIVHKVVFADLLHPTALALSVDGSGLYVTGEGAESVVRLDLTANGDPAVPDVARVRAGIPVPAEPEGAADAADAGAVLSPLSASRHALVATLLAAEGSTMETNPDLGDAGLDAKGAERAAVADGNGVNRPSAVPSVTTNLFCFLSGQDEMLSRQRAEARERLQDDERSAAVVQPVLAALDQVFGEWLPTVALTLNHPGQLLADTGLAFRRWTFTDDEGNPWAALERAGGNPLTGIAAWLYPAGMEMLPPVPIGTGEGVNPVLDRPPLLDLKLKTEEEAPAPPLPVEEGHGTPLWLTIVVAMFVTADAWSNAGRGRQAPDLTRNPTLP